MPVARRRRDREAKNKKPRDWKQILWYVLSALIALSMVLAYVLPYLAGN